MRPHQLRQLGRQFSSDGSGTCRRSPVAPVVLARFVPRALDLTQDLFVHLSDNFTIICCGGRVGYRTVHTVATGYTVRYPTLPYPTRPYLNRRR